ncbi:MAG: phasin family protein [Magnetococcales bacterium]|nr:phasin family protein [Magnetococcales bacterium]
MDNNKVAERMTDLTKKMMDSISDLQRINDRTVQELTKQQLEAAEGFITAGAKQLKDLSSAKTIQEAVSTQADIATNLGKMMVDNAKRTMDVLTQGQNELKVLIEKNITKLVEEAKAGLE